MPEDEAEPDVGSRLLRDARARLRPALDAYIGALTSEGTASPSPEHIYLAVADGLLGRPDVDVEQPSTLAAVFNSLLRSPDDSGAR